VTAQPAAQATADRAASDPATLVPTATAAARPTDHITAGQITEFLHQLAEPGVRTRRDDPTRRAALPARKTDLLRRIAAEHTPTPAGPLPPTTPPPTTPPPTTPPPTTPKGRTP
jgi:hypothetical protein